MKLKLGNCDKKEVIFYVALAVVYVYMFFTMFYADLTVTLQFAMTYLDSAFDGQFASFYNNALATGIAPEGAVYDVGIYFAFAVWGLPIYLLNKVVGLDFLSTGSLLWFKLLLLVFVFAIGKIVTEIAEEIGIESKDVKKLWLLSPLVIFPVLIVAQYDIIPLFFMMKGVLYSIRNEKKKSILHFSVAFTMKPFSLLTFLIVILIKEKNIVNIIKYTFFSIIPFVGCKIIYLINPTNHSTNNDFLVSGLQGMFNVKLSLGNGEISLFAFAFFVLCAWCYMYEPVKNKEEDGKWLIWYLYLAWLSFCVLTPAIAYWVVYLAPFVVLISFYCCDKINRIFIMEGVASIGFILVLAHKFTWVYGGSTTYGYLFLKNYYATKQKVHTVAGGMDAIGLGNFMPVLYGIVVGAFLLLAYQAYISLKDRKEKNEKIWELHWWGRVGFLCAWCMLTLVILIISK